MSELSQLYSSLLLSADTGVPSDVELFTYKVGESPAGSLGHVKSTWAATNVTGQPQGCYFVDWTATIVAPVHPLPAVVAAWRDSALVTLFNDRENGMMIDKEDALWRLCEAPAPPPPQTARRFLCYGIFVVSLAFPIKSINLALWKWMIYESQRVHLRVSIWGHTERIVIDKDNFDAP